MKAALSVPVAAITDPVVALEAEVGPRTWIARLRTGRVAIFPTSGSKISNAVAAEISEVTVLAVEDLAEVIASAVEDSVAAASADSAAAVGAVEDNYLVLNLL